MEFQAFRIGYSSYHSDKGWYDLFFDTITGLIGQNKSGKFSVL